MDYQTAKDTQGEKMRKPVHIHEALHSELKSVCKETGYTIEAFANRAIRNEIDRQGLGLRAKVKAMTRKREGAA